MAVQRPLMIFDGDCAFCSSSARVLKRISKGKIAIEPYQLLDLKHFGLTDDQTSKAVYYISKKTYLANRAIAQFLIDSKTIWGVFGYVLNLPILSWVAEKVYYWIARNRHRLPGGTPECSLRGRENDDSAR